MSRYKVSKWTGCYPGIVILLTAVERSRHQHYDSVYGAGAEAKTMTSLLIIPSVLAKVMLFFCHYAGSVWTVESYLFFLVFGQYPGSEES